MKFYVKTFGCSYNFAESEIMSGLLEKEGHELVNGIDECDFVILNSCTVKNSADTKFKRAIEQARLKDKQIILAGCYPQARSSHFLDSKYPVIGTFNISKILKIVNKDSLNKISLLKSQNEKKLGFPRTLHNDVVGIVPISQGCLDVCSYCLTRFARGKLFSYKKEDILSEIYNLVKLGAKEIWLTSQDNGCYGFDLGYDISDLMKLILNNKDKILSKSEDHFIRIRIGMANPRHLIKIYKKIIPLFKDEIFYKFLHIPVQSGSSKVLTEMKRYHTIEDFYMMVNDFKKEFPDMVLATDIIVGFPTETQEDFNKTLQLCKDIDFDVMNISRFWARPYTSAIKMKQLDSKIIKQRSKELGDYYYSRIKDKNKKYIGFIYENCLMNEIGKDSTSKFRNNNYKQIVVKNLFKKGSIKKIQIVDAKTHHLIGQVLR